MTVRELWRRHQRRLRLSRTLPAVPRSKVEEELVEIARNRRLLSRMVGGTCRPRHWQVAVVRGNTPPEVLGRKAMMVWVYGLRVLMVPSSRVVVVGDRWLAGFLGVSLEALIASRMMMEV